VVIIGLHKDNSTAYEPYRVSWESKRLINQVKSRNEVMLNVFGSPYALQDVDISEISSVLVSSIISFPRTGYLKMMRQ